MPKAFWFSYGADSRTTRVRDHVDLVDLHRVRDGGAALSLLSAIQRVGYEYVGQIVNFDQELPWSEASPRRDSVAVLTDADLLVLTTRPPLDDEEKGAPRRRVGQSGSALEAKLFTGLRKHFFKAVDRSRVLLRDELIDKLPPEQQAYGKLFFQINYRPPGPGVLCTELRGGVPAHKDFTAGYLLGLPPSAWEGGGRLIGAFGIGGVATLAFNHFLAKNQTWLLDVIQSPSPRLIVATMVFPTFVPYPYVDWKAEELIVEKVVDVPFSS